MAARQMLELAYRLNLVPGELYGKTQHKTLHARLSEDIARKRNRSAFVRTGPGRFYLRGLLDQKPSEGPVREYHAPIRSEQLERFDVLTITESALSDVLEGQETRTGLDILPLAGLQFVSFNTLRDTPALIYFRLLVVVSTPSGIVSRIIRNDSNQTETRSLALTGYVKRNDETLFSPGTDAIIEASKRLFLEQLGVEMEALDKATIPPEPSAIKLFPADNARYGHFLAVVCNFGVPDLSSWQHLMSTETHDAWTEVSPLVNDVEGFDLLSRTLLDARALPLGHLAVR